MALANESNRYADGVAADSKAPENNVEAPEIVESEDAGVADGDALDSLLRRVAAEIEELYQRGDFVGLERAVDRNFLPAYFGILPERFQLMLEGLLAADADAHGIARGMLFMFPGRDNPRDFLPTAKPQHIPYSQETTMLLGRITELRLQGRAHESSYLLDRLDEELGAIPPLFSDPSGFGILFPLQAGITAMIGGDLKRALGYFTRAQLQPMLSSVPFLTRDAYSKEALIHALFGRSADARRALDRAAEFPRVGSWVEMTIDGTEELAEAILRAEDDEEAAVQCFDAISLHVIGEMWPFYVIGMRQVFGRGVRHREFLERLSRLDQLPFPRVDGEGLAGSVIPISRASASLSTGGVDIAEHLLNAADPEYFGTVIARLNLDLVVNRPQQALRTAGRLADPNWSGLWKLDLWRLAGQAEAYLELGRDAEAREALSTLLAAAPDPSDLLQIPDRVLDFAAAEVAGWPERDPTRPRVVDTVPDSSTRLTAREFEVVRLLATDQSQQKIADLMFVSLNTLKSHIKAIYRKLDVTTRAAAVLRAEREGWV